jgi:hypothetical protein
VWTRDSRFDEEDESPFVGLLQVEAAAATPGSVLFRNPSDRQETQLSLDGQ